MQRIAKNKFQIGKFVKTGNGKSLTFLLVCRNLPGKANSKIVLDKKPTLQGTIHDSFDEAYTSVNKMKADSGHGVSTRIVLYNETPESLIFTGSDNYAGYWEVRPPVEVSKAEKKAIYVHV